MCFKSEKYKYEYTVYYTSNVKNVVPALMTSWHISNSGIDYMDTNFLLVPIVCVAKPYVTEAQCKT